MSGRVLLAVVGVVAISLAVGTWFVLPDSDPASQRLGERELEARIQYTCRQCHAVPAPESVPRALWERELVLAYSFIRDSDVDPERVPPFEQTLEYFERRAPERYARPAILSAAAAFPEFRPKPFGASDDAEAGPALPTIPGVSQVAYFPLTEADRPDPVVCDMRNSRVLLGRGGTADLRPIAEVPFPARAEPADVDGDGRLDLVVAALGSAETSDKKTGMVVLLRQLASGDAFEPVLIADGLGRVADVRVADFDADGDSEFLVAEFGGRKEGRVLLLRRTSRGSGPPRLDLEVLDERTGCIHLPIADLNGDGLLDFVALFSQEHEQVVAFLNMGGGRFRKETIFDARNPGYGSSGIELVDLDGDGDLDVVMTNGDTLDFQIHRPYHQVQWLENTGTYPFRHHSLASLPGVLASRTADLDLDGDLDIVASTFLPFGILDPVTGRNLIGEWNVPSLVWFEQTRPKEFVPHVLENGRPSHAALAVADVDGDGDLDLLTGHFSLVGITHRAIDVGADPRRLTVWENRLRSGE